MGGNVDMASLLGQYKKLGKHDRRAILKKLPEDIGERLSEMLKSEMPSQLDLKTTPADDQSEYAPWIAACLSPDKRKGFPALRDDFEMTPQASETLRQALGIQSEDIGPYEQTVVPANDTDESQHQGPSLMNKMGGFLSKKIMSL